jgi:hypothetical protein
MPEDPRHNLDRGALAPPAAKDPDPRITVVIIENFKIYRDSVLEQLKDADACIW